MDDVVAGEETLSLAAHRDGLIELGARRRHLLRHQRTPLGERRGNLLRHQLTPRRLTATLRAGERLADQPPAMDEHEVEATGRGVHPQRHQQRHIT
jgi:hypothetical protein